jgi:hypothetical protein
MVEQSTDNHCRYNLVIQFEQTISVTAIPDKVVMPLVHSTIYESKTNDGKGL